MGTIDHIYGYCGDCRSSVRLRVVLNDYRDTVVENHPCPIKGCEGIMQYD